MSREWVISQLEHFTVLESQDRSARDIAAGNSEMRLTRLRWEIDAFLHRLAGQETLTAIKREERERQVREEARALSARIAAGSQRRGALHQGTERRPDPR